MVKYLQKKLEYSRMRLQAYCVHLLGLVSRSVRCFSLINNQQKNGSTLSAPVSYKIQIKRLFSDLRLLQVCRNPVC
jgi:hypothetical protein